MADKIEIEVYKGQTIFYNEYSDKFECDISVEDKAKSVTRKTPKDVRKEIDSFIKLNLEFKPFKCLMKSWGDSFDIINVSAIRTDGKLVNSSGSHLDKDDMKKLLEYNADVEARYLEMQKEREAFNISQKKELAELLSKLKPIDLSKYDALINPKQD